MLISYPVIKGLLYNGFKATGKTDNQRHTEDAIGHCRHVRGLGNSMVVFPFV